MSYFPPPAQVEDAKIINYSKLAVTVIPLATQIGNAIELLKVRFDFDAGITAQQILILMSYFQAALKRTAGAGNVRLCTDASADGVTWSNISNMSSIGAAFAGDNDFGTPPTTLVQDNQFYFRLAAYCSNGTTSGEIKEVKAIFKIALPHGVSMVRLI